MATLVRFRASQGETLYGVNPDQVTFVQDADEVGTCILRFQGDAHISVAGTFEEVMRTLSDRAS